MKSAPMAAEFLPLVTMLLTFVRQRVDQRQKTQVRP